MNALDPSLRGILARLGARLVRDAADPLTDIATTARVAEQTARLILVELAEAKSLPAPPPANMVPVALDALSRYRIHFNRPGRGRRRR